MDSWLKDNMNMKPFHVGDQLYNFHPSYGSQKRCVPTTSTVSSDDIGHLIMKKLGIFIDTPVGSVNI